MTRTLGKLGGFVFAAALSLAATMSTDAHSDASADPDAARLLQSHATERYNVAFPGQSIRAGAGRTAVNAPIEVVRQIVLDYGHYSEFIPRFQKSQVLGPKNGGTAVYLRVPILHGVAAVYAVTRFDPLKIVDGEEIVECVIDGASNVDTLHAVWHMRRVDDGHTILRLEMLLVPKFPAPSGLITDEVGYASDEAVTATRDRAELMAKGRADARAP